MLHPEPNLFLIVRDRAGLSANLPSIPSKLNEEEFNEHIKSLKKNYPSSDVYYHEHPRPKMLFPLSNSEDGNPMNYFSIATRILKESHFKQEMAELQQLLFSPYENHLKYITRYLDIGNFISYEDYKEQDNFANKKGFSLDIQPIVFEQFEEKLEQNIEFRKVTISQIKKLIADNFNFNTVNIFGRNMLWYADTPETTSYLINNTDIDIFHIDAVGTCVLNKCFLHTDIECSFGTLLTILDNMQKKSKPSTEYFLEKTFVLDTIVNEFVKSFDKNIIQVNNFDFKADNESLKKFEIFPELLTILNEFNKPLFNQLLSSISDTLEKINQETKPSMEKKKFVTDLYNTILEEHIPENTEKPTIKTIKF